MKDIHGDLLLLFVISIVYFYLIGKFKLKLEKNVLIQTYDFEFKYLLKHIAIILCILLVIYIKINFDLISYFTLSLIMLVIYLNIGKVIDHK